MKHHNKDYFFKYVSKNTLISVLKSQKMRWSSPFLFNDPFDLQDDPFDFTQNDIIEALIKNSRKVITTPNIEFIGEIDPTISDLRNAWQRGEIGDDIVEELESKYRKEMEKYNFELISSEEKLSIKKYFTENRVFCVSEENDNLLMWAHYSDSHKGAVIKIKCIPNLDNALCAASPVIYQKELPWIRAIDDMAKQFFKIGRMPDSVKWAYTKSTHWSYEKEWRCIGASRNLEKLYDYNLFYPEEVEAIFLGCKMGENEKDEIRLNLLNPKYAHIKVFQAITNNREFKLDFIEVDI